MTSPKDLATEQQQRRSRPRRSSSSHPLLQAASSLLGVEPSAPSRSPARPRQSHPPSPSSSIRDAEQQQNRGDVLTVVCSEPSTTTSSSATSVAIPQPHGDRALTEHLASKPSTPRAKPSTTSRAAPTVKLSADAEPHHRRVGASPRTTASSYSRAASRCLPGLAERWCRALLRASSVRGHHRAKLPPLPPVSH